MEWLKLWGYTYESAQDFFGIRGFLSNLYNDRYVGIDNEERFKIYIDQIILPQLHKVWNAVD